MRRVALSLALLGGILCAVVQAQSASPSTPDQPTIVTTGDTILTRAPDRAYVQVGAEGQGGKPAAAEQESAKVMTALQAAIKAIGIPQDALRTSSFSLQPRYDNSGGRTFIARHVIEVRVDDLTKLPDVIDAAGQTRATNVSSLRFDLKDRNRVELEALAAAVKDASERAQVIATAAGRTVAGIVKVQEQRLSAPAPVMRMDGGGGGRGGGSAISTPIEPGEVQVRAQVTLTIGLR